ncbi:hypothetical protein MUP00_06295 [Candidatus Bathyarchaeota archaeon]|nr:hypothetical protein [Candidatus Bathyarchaeota archaeon]
MSKIADRVFERLRGGESPRDVRKSVTSTARFVEGIQKFVTWAIPDTERLQKENAKRARRKATKAFLSAVWI